MPNESTLPIPRISAEREVWVLPWQTPRMAWTLACDFIGEVLSARNYESHDAVMADLIRLGGAVSTLLTTRQLLGAEILFQAEDMELTLAFRSADPDHRPVPQLAMPPIGILGELPASSAPRLVLRLRNASGRHYMEDAVNGIAAASNLIVELEYLDEQVLNAPPRDAGVLRTE